MVHSKFGYIVRKAQKRTPEQALKALIRAGIVTAGKELADHYKAKPKASAGPKAAAKAKAPARPKANGKPKAAAARTKAAAPKAAKKIEA